MIALLLFLSVALWLLTGWAWLFKPKASPENVERYIRLLDPQPLSQEQPQDEVTDDLVFSEWAGFHPDVTTRPLISRTDDVLI